MRKSVIRNDPGYDPNVDKYKVFLNGRELFDCHTADEEKGEALVYKIDDKGNIVRHGNIIEEEILYGEVKIIASEPH